MFRNFISPNQTHKNPVQAHNSFRAGFQKNKIVKSYGDVTLVWLDTKWALDSRGLFLCPFQNKRIMSSSFSKEFGKSDYMMIILTSLTLAGTTVFKETCYRC
jgi:hypothetical protein